MLPETWNGHRAFAGASTLALNLVRRLRGFPASVSTRKHKEPRRGNLRRTDERGWGVRTAIFALAGDGAVA